LSFGEREDIAIWHAQKLGVREIARRLGRDPSTISRELRRNASTRTSQLDYKASIAQWHAERRGRRPKVAKLVSNDELREYVQQRLSGALTAPKSKRELGHPGRLGRGATSRTEGTDGGSPPGARSTVAAGDVPPSQGTDGPGQAGACACPFAGRARRDARRPSAARRNPQAAKAV
jgi:hypothetical protein